jgi:hypothetical protein
MAEPVPAGSDGSAGTYRCTSCHSELVVASAQSLPPCPNCGHGQWDTVDSKDDPDLNQ